MYLFWISLVKDKLLVLVIFIHIYITLVLLQLFIAARILIWSGSAFACSKPFWSFSWCLLWGWWDGLHGNGTCHQAWRPGVNPKNPYKGRQREPTPQVNFHTHGWWKELLPGTERLMSGWMNEFRVFCCSQWPLMNSSISGKFMYSPFLSCWSTLTGHGNGT